MRTVSLVYNKKSNNIYWKIDLNKIFSLDCKKKKKKSRSKLEMISLIVHSKINIKL